MSEIKRLTIQNYKKILSAAHPEFTCTEFKETAKVYSIYIKSDLDDTTYTFKISRKEQRYQPNVYEMTLLWDEDGLQQLEVTEINKDDMLDYKYFFSLLCEIIKEHTIPLF